MTTPTVRSFFTDAIMYPLEFRQHLYAMVQNGLYRIHVENDGNLETYYEDWKTTTTLEKEKQDERIRNFDSD